MIDECALVKPGSKYCKKADLDRAFIAADAASNRLTPEQQLEGLNRGKALTLDEFLFCLVNIVCFQPRRSPLPTHARRDSVSVARERHVRAPLPLPCVRHHTDTRHLSVCPSPLTAFA